MSQSDSTRAGAPREFVDWTAPPPPFDYLAVPFDQEAELAADAADVQAAWEAGFRDGWRQGVRFFRETVSLIEDMPAETGGESWPWSR